MKPPTKLEAEQKGYEVWVFGNGDYSYKVDGIEYLIRNGKEIAKGDYVCSYDNGDYSYVVDLVIYKFNVDSVRYKFNKDGKETLT